MHCADNSASYLNAFLYEKSCTELRNLPLQRVEILVFFLPLHIGISNWAVIQTKNSVIFQKCKQNRCISHLDSELNNSTDVLLVTTFCSVEHVPFIIRQQLNQQTLKTIRTTKDYARSWILLAYCGVWWLVSWMRLCLTAGVWEFYRTSLLRDYLMLGTFNGLLTASKSYSCLFSLSFSGYRMPCFINLYPNNVENWASS
jgi:hypothetical protein